MSTLNPYQPPTTRLREALSAEVGGDCWRDGKELVVRPGCTLPGRCIKCNEPAAEPMQHARFYWHHPALYLVALINLLIYAVIALIVRKRTPVTIGLCEKHRARQRMSIVASVTGSLLGVGLVAFGITREAPGASVAGVVLLLASVAWGIVGSRVLVVTRIGENYTRFKGCSTEFLATLPAFYRTR